MNKFEKFLQTKNTTKEAFKALDVEKQAEMQNKYLGHLEELISKSMSKEEVAEAIKTAKADVTKLNGSEIAAQIKDLNLGSISQKTVEAEVNKFLEDNHEKLKSLQSQGSGVVEFTIKAVGDITTGSATNPDGIPEIVGTQVAPPSNANLRTTFIDGVVTTLETSNSAYSYTETYPKDGSFAFLAEGAEKPQIDFKMETRYATPVKIAAWQRLTTESVQDIRGLQSIATDFLRKKHDLKRQNGILFGDGISPNPKGATAYGRAFSAGAMALGVTNPNIMDVINACATDIYTTQNYEDEMSYMPTLCVLNPTDFYLQFVAVKNNDGNPLYPTASLFNRVNIGGMTIIPERSIPAGKIFVADMSKYNVTNYVGYTVKIGWVNDDFIKNQFVILGESRFHAFVKKLDEQAFIYDDIATIETAIKTV